jgi:hypothetical protein
VTRRIFVWRSSEKRKWSGHSRPFSFGSLQRKLNRAAFNKRVIAGLDRAIHAQARLARTRRKVSMTARPHEARVKPAHKK